MATISILYSCHQCGLNDVAVAVRLREPHEDVLRWMDLVGLELSRDHDMKSPGCRITSLSEVKIPVTGAEYIGGPAIQ